VKQLRELAVDGVVQQKDFDAPMVEYLLTANLSVEKSVYPGGE
jgi:hypothetical protein